MIFIVALILTPTQQWGDRSSGRQPLQWVFLDDAAIRAHHREYGLAGAIWRMAQ
jgi:hypothetical protein